MVKCTSSPMPIFAELQYRIRSRAAGQPGYPVSSALRVDGQDQIFPDDLLTIDLTEFFNLRTQFDKYDSRLSQVFFSSEIIKDALDKACAQVDQAGPGNKLRVRLLIDAGAQ